MNKKNLVAAIVFEILKLLGLYDKLEGKKDLATVVSLTQQAFFPKKDGKPAERWDISLNCKPEIQTRVMELMKKAGFVSKGYPTDNSYDGVILLGGHITERFLRRVLLLQQLPIQANEVIVLVGERPLHQNESLADASEIIAKLEIKLQEHCRYDGIKEYATETEMATYLLSLIDLPAWTKKKIRIVSTPMKQDSTGKPIRPTTEDTLVTWRKQYTKLTGNFLALSTQPDMFPQYLMVRDCLPDAHIEMACPDADSVQNMAVFLRALAATLYHIHNFKQ